MLQKCDSRFRVLMTFQFDSIDVWTSVLQTCDSRLGILMTCPVDSISVYTSLLQKCDSRLRILMTCRVDSIAVGTLLLQESFGFWEASCAPPPRRTQNQPNLLTDYSKGPRQIFGPALSGILRSSCLNIAAAEM